MSRSSRSKVEDTKRRVLAYVEGRRAADGESRPLSRRAMAADLGITAEQAKFACRALEGEGLISREPRFAESGGQLANVYRLTAAGREVLSAGAFSASCAPCRIQVLRVRLGPVAYLATRFSPGGRLDTLEMRVVPAAGGRTRVLIAEPGTYEPLFAKTVDPATGTWERFVQLYFKAAFDRLPDSAA